MDTIKRAIVLTAAQTQPKLFSAVAACIDRGGTKEDIMQKVQSIAPAWGLTAGLCDAVCDFFLSDEGREIVEKAKAAYFTPKADQLRRAPNHQTLLSRRPSPGRRSDPEPPK